MRVVYGNTNVQMNTNVPVQNNEDPPMGLEDYMMYSHDYKRRL